MIAVIMAGGKGTRLEPLTDRTPKPLVGFFGRPILEYQIEMLRRQGICDIILTVGHLKQSIVDHFGDGSRLGVRVRYVCEESPLGTAGGVKKASPLLCESFVVMSGDAVTDVDLRRAVASHVANSADVTLVLKEVEDPSKYGIVQTNSRGRVVRFVEKPSKKETFSHLVNTGMYVIRRRCLEFVPTAHPFDFSRDLFPVLLKGNARLFGYRADDGYWNDIGSLKEYLRSHMDALEGKVRLFLARPRTGISARASVHPGARVESLSAVGDQVCVDDGAVVGKHAFVGRGAHVGAFATLRRCVVNDGCLIGAHSLLEDCVLSPGTVVQPCSQIRPDAFAAPGHIRISSSVLSSRLEEGVIALGHRDGGHPVMR